MRSTINSAARAAGNLVIGTATVVVLWGAASSLLALGWAIDRWSNAVGGEERSR